ncbi:MAG: flagellar assembly peptidoglycan hydrolase FlgJ [Gammaproteobacteria bacterium]|nr:flagellar assembly peptidoglycan hydrolase FlgJ [Gammaproteobacteria bacterium]
MSIDSKTDIYTDLNGLQSLKTSARKDANAALPEVAKQFEAVMISMMIKNLRKTGMEDPIFKSQAMDSYRDMYDQQLGMELSKGDGIGFAKAIVRQMQYQQGGMPENDNGLKEQTLPQRRHFPDLYSNTASTESEKQVVDKNILVSTESVKPLQGQQNSFESPEQFVEKLWPLAEKTAQKLGVSPELILSQAALETGWGKHVISNDQKSSYNLFNIKAGLDWTGAEIEKNSMEFIHGKMSKQQSAFRSYDSFEHSFTDYARFIQSHPRYKNALEKTNKMEQSLHDTKYINEIHEAGYATDPKYSDKVLRVLNSEPVQNRVMMQVKLASK